MGRESGVGARVDGQEELAMEHEVALERLYEARQRIEKLEAALRAADSRLRELGSTTLDPARERIWRLLGEPTLKR